MKKEYNGIKCEITCFTSEDIITTSGLTVDENGDGIYQTIQWNQLND